MMEVRPPRRDHSDRTLLIYAREETAAVVAENVVCCVVIPPLPLLSLICSIPSLENVGVGGVNQDGAD